jgi:DNA primase
MNDYDLVKDIVDRVLGEPDKSNDMRGQYGYSCPVCSYDIKGLETLDGKGNLEVNYPLQVFKCWVCAETHGTYGHVGKLIDKFGNKRDKKDYNLIRPDEYVKDERKYQKLVLPKEYQKFSDVNPKYPPRAQAYNYLKSRGITDEIIEKYDIGFCVDGPYIGRIIVPSFDKQGELNYFIGRSWNPKSKFKYKNPEAPKELLIFNESRIDWEKDIFLVEGVFDAFFVPNAIPLLGKFLSDLLWETLYEKAKARIIVCLDPDAWEDSKKIYNKLNGGKLYKRIDIIKLPGENDLGDLKGIIPEDSYIKLERQ